LGCEATGCVTATWHDDLIKQLLELMLARGELAVADLPFSSTAAIRLTLSLVDPDRQGVPKPNCRRVWTGSLEAHFLRKSQNLFFCHAS
jgi:hypothetical protein